MPGLLLALESGDTERAAAAAGQGQGESRSRRWTGRARVARFRSWLTGSWPVGCVAVAYTRPLLDGARYFGYNGYFGYCGLIPD
jgi:hypothetical protein